MLFKPPDGAIFPQRGLRPLLHRPDAPCRLLDGRAQRLTLVGADQAPLPLLPYEFASNHSSPQSPLC